MQIENSNKSWKNENGAPVGGVSEPASQAARGRLLADVADRIRGRLKQIRFALAGRIGGARICEINDEIKAEIELPGVDAEGIEVAIDEKSAVRVHATRLEQREWQTRRYSRVERVEHVIRRTLWLGSPVDGDSARLVLANGVLTLRVRRAEQPRGLPKTLRPATV
jgi:HSP20 family molecular chaperone IbpA